MDGWMDQSIYQSMHGWIDAWMGGWMDQNGRWMDLVDDYDGLMAPWVDD